MNSFLEMIEKYVEWLVLALAGLWVGWIVWAYWVQSPVTVTVNGVTMPPSQVEAYINAPGRAVQVAKGVLTASAQPPKPVGDFVALVDHELDLDSVPQVAFYNSPFASPPPSLAVEPVLKETKLGAQATLPICPAPVLLGATTGTSVVLMPTVGAVAGAKMAMVERDISWVTVSAKFDVNALAAAFAKAQITAGLETEVLRVDVYRQEQTANGWGPEVKLKELPLVTMHDFPGNNGADIQAMGDYADWAGKNAENLVRPPFYELAPPPNGSPWYPFTHPAPIAQQAPPPPPPPPPAPVQGGPAVPHPAPLRLRNPGSVQPGLPPVSGGNTGGGPSGGGNTIGITGTASGTGSHGAQSGPPRSAYSNGPVHSYATPRTQGSPGSGAAASVQPPPPPTPSSSSPPYGSFTGGSTPSAGTPSRPPPPPHPGIEFAGGAPESGNGAGNAVLGVGPAGLSPPPSGRFKPANQGPFEIWFHDAAPDTAPLPGHTYRYRMVIHLLNPLWGHPQAVAKDNKAAADQFAISNDFHGESDWSEPVSVAPLSYFFVADGGNTNTGQVKMEIFEWTKGKWNLQTAKLAPGDAIGNTGWTIVDLRPPPPGTEMRIIVADDKGRESIRLWKTDEDDPVRKKLLGEVGLNRQTVSGVGGGLSMP